MTQESFAVYWDKPGAIEHEHECWLACPMKKAIAESVVKHVPSAKSVIDYCGATGTQLRRLYEAGFRGDCVLMDQSEECMKKYCEWFENASNGPFGGSMTIIQGDVRGASIEAFRTPDPSHWIHIDPVPEGGLFDVALWINAQKHMPLSEVWDITERLANTGKYFGVTVYFSPTDEDIDDTREAWPHVGLSRTKWNEFVHSRGWLEVDNIRLDGTDEFFLYKVQ